MKERLKGPYAKIGLPIIVLKHVDAMDRQAGFKAGDELKPVRYFNDHKYYELEEPYKYRIYFNQSMIKGSQEHREWSAENESK